MKHINVGMLGIGNVGQGTYQVLAQGRQKIEAGVGVSIDITKILCRHPEAKRDVGVPPETFTDRPEDILEDPSVDIVVELIGGIEPATTFMATALKNGKHVVTANKAAIAANGQMLQALAQEHGVMLRFEASVAGGIPIINAVTTALLSDEFTAVHGILNGTTNYILSQMSEAGRPYEDVLADAQAKGFAEADPTADVEGIDACNKLAILISLIFGIGVSPDDIPCHGITTITEHDIRYARENDYCIKLLASARKEQNGSADGGALYANVEPVFLPLSHPLAGVNNEFNAVFVKGNAVDDLMFYGRGAGPLPTGTAVLGDVITIAKQIGKEAAYDMLPPLRYDAKLQFAGEGESRYYVRISAIDKPGVLGKIAATFGRAGISIKSMVQRGGANIGNAVPLLFVVYDTQRATLDKALSELAEQDFVGSIDAVLRVES